MYPLVTAGTDTAPPFLRKEPVNQPKFHSGSDEGQDNVKGLTDCSEGKGQRGEVGKRASTVGRYWEEDKIKR